MRSLGRVFPGCITQSQAVAFNMFLAFFPILLLVLGAVTGSSRFAPGLREMVERMRPLMPPGSEQLLVEFLSRHTEHPWRWAGLGLVGTLIVGSQMMKLMMDGFCMIHGDHERPDFLGRHLRALLLLLATITPWLGVVVLLVFGRQMRAWMVHQVGLPIEVRLLWDLVYFGMALAIAVLVLAVIYRVGRSRTRSWNEVLPGALVAALLWWPVSSSFGLYMRHAPYGLVYGGLTVAIGLMIWMYLTATIIFIGAAFNAEIAARKSSLAPPATRYQAEIRADSLVR